MDLFTSDNPPPLRASLFLAGGITGCGDWQSIAVDMIEKSPNSSLLGIANPRYPLGEPDPATQIEWEYITLQRASSVLFWFPDATLCPITLFELGVFTQRKNIPLFVGCAPDYKRRFDVDVQLKLSRPEVVLRDNLEDTVNDFLRWSNPSSADIALY